MRRNKLQGESTLKVTMLSIDGVSIQQHIFLYINRVQASVILYFSSFRVLAD